MLQFDFIAHFFFPPFTGFCISKWACGKVRFMEEDKWRPLVADALSQKHSILEKPVQNWVAIIKYSNQ